jgi:hypothetical protein
MARCSRDCLDSVDKVAGAVSYLASLALFCLGGFAFYNAYRTWEATASSSHDFSLFLAVQGIFLCGGGLVCFLAEMRVPAIRASVLAGCSFTWSRQGRGWFFLYLGLYALFLPIDISNPWVTKTCGSFQLLAGVLLCCLAYLGDMKEDLYYTSAGGAVGNLYSSGLDAAALAAAAKERQQQRELEEWGGGGISRRHTPPEEGGSAARSGPSSVSTVNPFLEASKPKEADRE